MKKDKKERLEKAGWRVGSTRDFLDLSNAEHAVIEVRVMLARYPQEPPDSTTHVLKPRSQKELGSSSISSGKDGGGVILSVSLDLLVRSLFRP